MESRKITIVQTKNQKKSVIMSSATTLSELKNDLRSNGIDYNGMTFYEGLSKTELKADESILPHDIERNGIITNELVFMLTNSEKKIKSGNMSRAEAYAGIKSLGLQEVCRKKFGKNFTMCKTEDLIHLIKEYTTKSTTEAAKTESCCKGCDAKVKEALCELVEILVNNEFLTEGDADTVYSILNVEKTSDAEDKLECPYTQSEINNMFRNM